MKQPETKITRTLLHLGRKCWNCVAAASQHYLKQLLQEHIPAWAPESRKKLKAKFSASSDSKFLALWKNGDIVIAS